MKLTTKQIERLVKQGEVVHTECKDASGGLPDSLWESYSAFANTDGGVIFLGVKEVGGKFSIVGVPNATALIKRFWDGVNNREKVSVNILFDRHVYSVKCRGRDVVVIEVPRADRQDRPVYIGKDIFSNPGIFRVNKAVAVEGGIRCRQVYEALRQDVFLTYRGMVSKLGLNKDTINTAIGTLVRKGFIRREGNKQTGHWEVVK